MTQDEELAALRRLAELQEPEPGLLSRFGDQAKREAVSLGAGFGKMATGMANLPNSLTRMAASGMEALGFGPNTDPRKKALLAQPGYLDDAATFYERLSQEHGVQNPAGRAVAGRTYL